MQYDLNIEAERERFAVMLKLLQSQGIQFRIERNTSTNRVWIEVCGSVC